ncbi:MAG: M16 family metallopeptidase, partial [Saprospiraceae bacterium]
MKMKSNYTWLLVALVFLFLGNGSQAQNAKKETSTPDGIEKVTSVEGITEYRLTDNGLKVLLFPDQSKPTITVNITYLVGSRHEGYGETGMAHLLEHLVFKGTPNHPDIPQELTEHGARPNGTTWYDRTNYFETFNATEKNLRWALDMESDRMVNSFIAKKDLESEMTVVRNEFEMGENDPSSILMERVISTAYLWHNYGNSTIGARADIENVPIENLQAFYHKYYQPDNAVLVVAGKIDVAQTLAMIAEYFGKIPRPERKLTPTFTKEPTQDGERSVTLRRSGDVQVVSCMYHTPPGSHRDYAAVSVLDEILTNEPGGRLYKALVETKKASTVWSFAPGLKEGGFLYINADVRMENSLDEAK